MAAEERFVRPMRRNSGAPPAFSSAHAAAAQEAPPLSAFSPQAAQEATRESAAREAAREAAQALEVRWAELQAEVAAANREGLRQLREGAAREALRHFTRSQELLCRGEEVCGKEERRALAGLRVDNASNLGLSHKRCGNQALAIRHLQRALKLCRVAGSDLRTQVAAHLNLSTCHLEAEVADAAMRHAVAAVELGGHLVTASPGPAEGGGCGEPKPDDYAMLAVAYHKMAEAHEGLREWGKATFAYTQAYEVVKRSLGPEHHLTRFFEKSSRCPQRANAPEVPLSWRAPNTPRQLPNIASARPRSTGHDLSSYHLGAESFPSWPPKAASEEEQLWYAMAQQHKQQQRAGQHSTAGRKKRCEPTLEAFLGPQHVATAVQEG